MMPALLLATGAFLSSNAVVLDQLQLKPPNVTVLKGSPVQFFAHVRGSWKIMTWFLGEFLVLTVNSDGVVISISDRLNASFCFPGDISCVKFMIQNATRTDSGPVTCTVQGLFGSKTAHLHVHELGTVRILGGNVTALRDEPVEFRCETTGWFPAPALGWRREGRPVNASLFNVTSVGGGGGQGGGSYNSTSALRFKAVSNTKVECLASVRPLEDPLSSSVYLDVVTPPPDWTVLIAVVASVAGVALLALLILGIIFCWRRRKEKERSYQDDIRRVRTQSQLSTVSPVARKKGHANGGFESERPANEAATFPNRIFIHDELHIGSSPRQLPGNGSAAEERDHTVLSVRKFRHVTIV